MLLLQNLKIFRILLSGFANIKCKYERPKISMALKKKKIFLDRKYEYNVSQINPKILNGRWYWVKHHFKALHFFSGIILLNDEFFLGTLNGKLSVFGFVGKCYESRFNFIIEQDNGNRVKSLIFQD